MCASAEPQIFVDTDEKDILLPEDPIGMCLLPVGTRDVVSTRRQEVIGGNGYGLEHGSIDLIDLTAAADHYGFFLEKPREDDGSIIFHGNG